MTQITAEFVVLLVSDRQNLVKISKLWVVTRTGEKLISTLLLEANHAVEVTLEHRHIARVINSACYVILVYDTIAIEIVH
jgi:hypothetical protein